jgi:hypothetical protein
MQSRARGGDDLRTSIKIGEATDEPHASPSATSTPGEPRHEHFKAANGSFDSAGFTKAHAAWRKKKSRICAAASTAQLAPAPRGPVPKVDGTPCTWDGTVGFWRASDGSKHEVQTQAARTAERARLREACVWIEIDAIRRMEHKEKYTVGGVTLMAVATCELGARCENIEQLKALQRRFRHSRSAGPLSRDENGRLAVSRAIGRGDPTQEGLEALWWRWSPPWHHRHMTSWGPAGSNDYLSLEALDSHHVLAPTKRQVKAEYDEVLGLLLKSEGISRSSFDAVVATERSAMVAAEAEGSRLVERLLVQEAQAGRASLSELLDHRVTQYVAGCKLLPTSLKSPRVAQKGEPQSGRWRGLHPHEDAVFLDEPEQEDQFWSGEPRVVSGCRCTSEHTCEACEWVRSLRSRVVRE